MEFEFGGWFGYRDLGGRLLFPHPSCDEAAVWMGHPAIRVRNQGPQGGRWELQGLVAGPGLVGGVAEVLEGAVGAAGFAGDADLAAVVNEFVGELDPAVAGDDLLQVLFDLYGVGFFGEFEAVGEAVDVRVYDYA